jgi:4'-phosphopantetheinyl transferase
MSYDWEKIIGCAHAWWVNGEKVAERSLPMHWLDAEERALAQEFSARKARHQYLVARMLSRAVLSYYTGVAPGDWRFGAGKFGKPRIEAPKRLESLKRRAPQAGRLHGEGNSFNTSSLRFNLTHTNGLIVCLVSRAGEVGVDAEKISRRVHVEEIAEHFLAKSEWDELAKLAGAKRRRRFFEIWALKEAYLKGRGRGFSVSPQRVAMEFDSNGKPLPKREWQLALHKPRKGYVAATAILARKAIPIVWKDARGLLKA